MNFEISPQIANLRQEVRSFITEFVFPNERAIVEEDRAGKQDTLRRLQSKAKDAGLWVPHLPAAYGGLGLGIMGMCVLFREMGRSPLGAKVFNCDAPNQGNMDLLLRAASDPLRDRYLAPLAAGEITSAFCMTEPAPGAGADPSNLRTRAVKDGDGASRRLPPSVPPRGETQVSARMIARSGIPKIDTTGYVMLELWRVASSASSSHVKGDNTSGARCLSSGAASS